MSTASDLRPPLDASPGRHRAYTVIFGHKTRAGRRFDVLLIVAILASVLVIMLESVASVRADYGGALRGAEWFFTVLFTVEYVTRLWCVGRPLTYAKSFLGLIDLLAVLPTYVSVLVPGGQVLTVVRILRVLRVFRILKLAHYVGEAGILVRALRASQHKITVFVLTIVTITVIVGSLMYLIEGPGNGFTSIPRGVYWSVVTLTTVGFRRHHTSDAMGPGARERRDDHGVRHHCRADGDRDRGARVLRPISGWPRMPGLWTAGPRRRRAALQIVRGRPAAIVHGYSGSSSSCPSGPAFSTSVRPTVDCFPQHP